MEVKQEPVDIFIEEHKIKTEEYCISNETVKTEFVSIKQERDDDDIRFELQQTDKSETVDETDLKCSLAEMNEIKQPKKEVPKKQNNIKPLNPHGGSTDEKPFKCDICSKTFTQKGTLNVHMRYHTGDKPFECEVCLKSFTTNTQAKLHTMRYHTGEKPFKCDICSKTFTQKGTLNVHMRYHTGDKPFKCEVCLKLFATNSQARSHIVRCHTGEKSFKCEICLKLFTINYGLKLHMRCHTGERPFKCEFCSKSFITNSQLKFHMRCHTGAEPFKCEVCFKTFNRKGCLNRHMRSHTNEKR